MASKSQAHRQIGGFVETRSGVAKPRSSIDIARRAISTDDVSSVSSIKCVWGVSVIRRLWCLWEVIEECSILLSTR